MTDYALRFSRAPDGVVTHRPVLMRLLPQELDILRDQAKAANSSLSAMARSAVLVGLTQIARVNHADCVNDIPPQS